MRAALVWEVRAYEWDGGDTDADFDIANKDWPSLTEHWQSANRGQLRVKTVSAVESDSLEPSAISPGSAYRGPQNQLYRVEIHHSGTAKQGATFKVSRENAAVTFGIETFADPTVTLSGLGRDTRSTLSVGDWVEISDDDTIFRHAVHPLRQVESVDRQRNIVTLQAAAGEPMTTHKDRHPVLTRWDHKQGDPRRGGLDLKDGAALSAKEATTGSNWKMESRFFLRAISSSIPLGRLLAYRCPDCDRQRRLAAELQAGRLRKDRMVLSTTMRRLRSSSLTETRSRCGDHFDERFPTRLKSLDGVRVKPEA